MAALNDGTAVVSGSAHFADTISLASKTTSGADRVGVLLVGWESGAGVISGIPTWNGANMTHVFTQTNDLVQVSHAAVYVIAAPPTAGSTVVVNFTDGVRGGACAVSFNGVDQATMIRSGSTVGLESDAGGTQSVTVNATAGDMAVDSTIVNSPAANTVGGGQTQIFNVESTAGGEFWAAGSYEAISGSSVVMSWDSTDDAFAIAAVALQAAAAGGLYNQIPTIYRYMRRTMRLLG